ncbi:MAG: hypothetical protein KAU90_02005, partial [Sulfurovaceae bacterium]|nr:hypothetical protein [Sulfurovaceae bacterium]
KIETKKINKIRTDILSIKGIEKYKFNQIALARWITYCEKNRVRYNQNNLKHWLEKLNKRTTIEQIESVNKAINNKWKDFYLKPIKESPYHKFLGRSLMTNDRDCDTLIDISFKDNKFVYQFKNIKITTAEPPLDIFNRYGYTKSESKDAPIISSVKDKIMSCFKKM